MKRYRFTDERKTEMENMQIPFGIYQFVDSRARWELRLPLTDSRRK